ncbi:MAG: hypothetical protein K6E91_07770 [Butyrivibrio sp.]|nr:hypothetical protein [Butyrivibrio sp.]
MKKKRVLALVVVLAMMTFAAAPAGAAESGKSEAQSGSQQTSEDKGEAAKENNGEAPKGDGDAAAENDTAAGASESEGAAAMPSKTQDVNDGESDVATYCSFVIPGQFEISEYKGVFVNKSYPMESSTIQYSYYDNGLSEMLTNREKQERKEENTLPAAVKTAELTKGIYEETLAAAYNKEYGEDVGFTVSSFDNITVDGYPGYKIESSFTQTGQETVHQTVYLLLSKYRTFTVTFQRAEDDDCEELFENCAATIHVH